MYHLATLFPFVRRIRLPVSRDQIMLLLTAVNLLFMGLDILLAHNTNNLVTPNEWIPIIFGFVGGVALLLAGVIALRNRPLATVMANIVFVGSIIVGGLGMFFHLGRTVLFSVPAGQVAPADALIWAPPVLGPFFFMLVGVLGISAAWIEDPVDSGQLVLLGNRRIRLPYAKTRAYFFIVAVGILATVIMSTLDHARGEFRNPWTWLPLIAGLFAVGVALMMGVIERPGRGDIAVYFATMALLTVVGLVGALLHVNTNLIPRGAIVVERFLRGSPLLAPLLYANFALLGLVVLLDPREDVAPMIGRAPAEAAASGDD
jgi:hypothetical protein